MKDLSPVHKTILNIRKASAELIVKEIDEKGVSRVARPDRCITKVKEILGIELIETEKGSGILKRK